MFWALQVPRLLRPAFFLSICVVLFSLTGAHAATVTTLPPTHPDSLRAVPAAGPVVQAAQALEPGAPVEEQGAARVVLALERGPAPVELVPELARARVVAQAQAEGPVRAAVALGPSP